jgi:hypothetical protein
MRKIYLAAAAALLTLSACNDSNKDRDRNRDRDRSESSERDDRDRDRDREGERDGDRDRNARDEGEGDGSEEQVDVAVEPSTSGLSAQVRSQLAAACRSNSATANIPNINVAQLCDCVADRASSRSEGDMRTILSGGPAARAIGEQVGRECAMQQLGGGAR